MVGRPSRLKKLPGILPAAYQLFGELDGEREEVGAGARLLGAAGGDENAGVAVADEDGAVSLFWPFCRFRWSAFCRPSHKIHDES